MEALSLLGRYSESVPAGIANTLAVAVRLTATRTSRTSPLECVAFDRNIRRKIITERIVYVTYLLATLDQFVFVTRNVGFYTNIEANGRKVVIVILFGIKDGIERLMAWIVPMLVLVLVAVAVMGLTLEGGMQGIVFAFQPNWEYLTRSQTWIAALGQALFSTGLGWGIALTFGSYLGEYDDIPLGGGVFTAIGNTATALLAVFAVFPIVYAFGLEPTAGPQLTFITLVNIFPQMPGGRFWAIAFFVGFFFAAFLGGLAITEVTVTTVKEETRLGRTGTVLAVSAIIWLVGLPSAYSNSFFNIMDFLFGNFGLPLATLLILLTVGWKIGPEKIRVIALNHNSDIHIGQWWDPLVQYIVPLSMIIIVVSFVITHIGSSLVKTVGGVVLMIVIPVAAVLLMGAVRRRNDMGSLLSREGGD